MIEPAIEITEEADIFVVIGTSLNVYPAAGLLRYVRPQVPIYLIDPKEVKVPVDRSVRVIQKGASEGVAELIALLRRIISLTNDKKPSQKIRDGFYRIVSFQACFTCCCLMASTTLIT